jgi:hypothetical protein
MIRARACVRHLVGLGLVLASLGGAARAAADDPVAAAEALFQDGRRLMDAKKYTQACAKFAASQRLDPRSGTLLNLADCYEKNGQTASAWARFREAQTLAARQNRNDRERIARERADLLEPKLPKLNIDVSGQSDVEVKRDGIVVDAGALGTAVPVDPGKHTIEASAKGKKGWSTIVDVSGTVNLRIPLLETEDPTPVPQPIAKVEGGDDGAKKGDGGAKKGDGGGGSGSTQKTLGIVAAGAGLVAVGIGAAFGLTASSKWGDAKPRCSNGECDAEGVALAEDAKSAGNMSTVMFIVGGALVAGGAVLFFTAPSPASGGSLNAGVTPTGAFVRGTF